MVLSAWFISNKTFVVQGMLSWSCCGSGVLCLVDNYTFGQSEMEKFNNHFSYDFIVSLLACG